MTVDTEYVTSTLTDLVRINSVNPAFSSGATDELEIAVYVKNALTSLGLTVTTFSRDPNRPSVVGRLGGHAGGKSLMLYAHMDTVGIEGMDAPLSAAVRDGRLYGRGTYDMKGGLAACISAVKTLLDSGSELAGDLLVVAVADEETESIGMQEVLRHASADAAIVTEPTELEVCVAHKGFCWIEVLTRGRAAHGSRFHFGVDANMRMGRFLSQLGTLEQKLRTSPPHALVGPPSLHAATLHGGTGASTYAAESRLVIERRTIPGETTDQAVDEIQHIVDDLSRHDPTFEAEVSLLLTRPAFEVAPEAEIVRTIMSAARDAIGARPRVIGQTPWTDAAFLGDAGIETVVIGPAGAGAHAAEEWVEIDSVVTLAGILAQAAEQYCGMA